MDEMYLDILIIVEEVTGVSASEMLTSNCEEHVKKKHIPCNNWYWTLSWNQQNFCTFFRDSDGTHLYQGFRWLANKIHAFVTSN